MERKTIPLSGKLDDREKVWMNPRPFEEMPEELREQVLNRKDLRSSDTALDRLEGKHVLSLILYIDRMSPVMKSDIYSDISRSMNISDKLNMLYKMGLIDIFQTVRNNSNVFVITDKGHSIAQHIREMLEVIESE